MKVVDVMSKGNKIMIVIVIAFLFAVGLIAFWEAESFRVIKVISGDTIQIQHRFTVETVKLEGVDAPDAGAAGEMSTAYAKKFIGDHRIKLGYDKKTRDSEGNLLAYVYVKGNMLNESLIEKGYAVSSGGNFKYCDLFHGDEVDAEYVNAGLWAAGDLAPSEY